MDDRNPFRDKREELFTTWFCHLWGYSPPQRAPHGAVLFAQISHQFVQEQNLEWMKARLRDHGYER